MIDVSSAMKVLHQSMIIHRDLKPENILVVSLEPHSEICAKLSDFGTTRDVNLSPEEGVVSVVGSPLFMAPEVLTGKPYDKSVDVYSFAKVMFVTLTGRIPHSMSSEIPTEIPPVLGELMRECWSNQPSERPSFDCIHDAQDEFFRNPTAVFGKDKATGKTYQSSDEAEYNKAVHSMKSGDESAKTKVAFYLLSGRGGVKVDKERAFAMLTKQRSLLDFFPALPRDGEKEWMTGLCYEYGMGTTQDTDRAEEYYRQSCEDGNAAGMFFALNPGHGRGSGKMTVKCT